MIFWYDYIMQQFKTVSDFLESLDDNTHAQVEALRKLILGVEPDLSERIKWNAPSYVLHGEDRITFNLMNNQGVVKLVLHMGASKQEDKHGTPILAADAGIVEWSSNIRGIISFDNLQDIEAKKSQLLSVVQRWLAL